MSIEKLLKLAEEKKRAEQSSPETPAQAKTISLPHLKTSKAQVGTVSQPRPVSTVSQSSLIRSVTQKVQSELSAAPTRDFQKVANSVVREVAQGIFNGKSKQMYDYLYSLTRGAIAPNRKIRISKPKLMKGTGIGSPQTFYRNISHLESLGLIKRNEIVGERDGNEYEVFLPEEIDLKLVESVQSVQSVNSVQKQVVLVLPETERTDSTPQPINTGLSDYPKTSFKDNTIDDDHARISKSFSVMNRKLDVAVKKLTGNGVSISDREGWGTLADFLILELEVAAKRTGSISNVPAFLTEVLRRQFFSARREQKSPSAKSPQVKPNKIGQSNSEIFEIKPLDELGREAALTELKEFADDEFLGDFEKWYTPDDWNWLQSQLFTRP